MEAVVENADRHSHSGLRGRQKAPDVTTDEGSAIVELMAFGRFRNQFVDRIYSGIASRPFFHTQVSQQVAEPTAKIDNAIEVFFAQSFEGRFETDPLTVLIPAKRSRVVSMLQPSLPIALLRFIRILFPHSANLH